MSHPQVGARIKTAVDQPTQSCTEMRRRDFSNPETTHEEERRDFKTLLENNELGFVENPLTFRNIENLRGDVEAFHAYHKLQNVVNVELLFRGAWLAKDKPEFTSKDAMPEFESDALNREKKPELVKQSRELNTILLTCCIGAIVHGWSQASIIGANLQWPYAFGLQTDYEDGNTITSFWIFGGVNAITYFAASFVGAWLSDPLNESFGGRRGALFVAGVFTLAASIGSAFTFSWQGLLCCRLVLGIGYGAGASVVPVFVSEAAPPKSRGRLLVSWQTFIAVGILLGSAMNLVFHGPHSVLPSGTVDTRPRMLGDGWRQKVAWRIQIASCAIPTVPLLCLVLICSESPRWLVKKNDYAKAFEVLRTLRETPLQAARDLYYIYAQLRVETLLFSENPDIERLLNDWTFHDVYKQELKSSSYGKRFLQLFTVPRNRRSSLAVSVVMTSQQFSGINIFAFLSTTVFSAGSAKPMENLWLSFGFAASNALFSPLAYWIIDKKGRRSLLLASLITMVPLLLVTAFAFKIHEPTAKKVAVEVFVIIYTAAYSPGAGVVPFLYSSEVFPLINREAGMSLSCSVNFLLAGILALTVPQLTHVLGPTGLLGLFAGLDALAAIFVWLLVPGTVQETTLEEMNYIFGVPTINHVKYQTRKGLPWIVRRCIPGKSAETLTPLYIWNHESREDEEMQHVTQEQRQTQTIASPVN